MKKSYFTATLIAVSGLAANAGTIFLYDADPDNNAATPAPDPLTQGWQHTNLDGSDIGVGFSSAGTTTGGAQAWRFNDTSFATGNGPGQSNAFHFDVDVPLAAALTGDPGNTILTITLEQLSTGSFVGIGLNNDSIDTFNAGIPDRRFGQSPDAGLQTITYTYDGTALTPNTGAGLSTGGGQTSDFWVGSNDGGFRIFLADNSRNSSGFNLALQSVTVESNVIPEPSSIALLGLGGLALIRRRRK